MIQPVCPGRCNAAWRLAEATLAADGTPHDVPLTWGQPVHCERCAGRARTQLAELPELVVAVSLEALHGTAPKTAGTIGRTPNVRPVSAAGSPKWGMAATGARICVMRAAARRTT